MSQKKTFSEEALERVRSGRQPESHKKKRKLSRAVLIIDAIIVLAIFLFFFKDNKAPEFYSTSLEYKNCRIRYSINKDNAYNDYHFSVQIKGLSETSKFKVKDSFATVKLYYKKKEIKRFNLGDNIKHLNIAKNSIKSFTYTLERDEISKIIKAPKRKKRQYLIEFENNLTIESQLIINTEDTVSTKLNFQYEVPK